MLGLREVGHPTLGIGGSKYLTWSLEEFLIPMWDLKKPFHLVMSSKKVDHPPLNIGELLFPTWSIVEVGSQKLSLEELCYPMLDLGKFVYLVWGKMIAYYHTLEVPCLILVVEGVWDSRRGFEDTWPHA